MAVWRRRALEQFPELVERIDEDDWGLRAQVAPWLSPTVTRDVWPLWEARLAEEQLAELRALLADGGGAGRWRELRRVTDR